MHLNPQHPNRSNLLLLLVALLPCLEARGQSRSKYELPRKEMVQTAVIGAGVKNKRVIQAMGLTKRHEFVRSNLRDKAYLDMALPIGDQQTISSPFIVAFMTEAIDPQPNDKVLEIGTGSGYQAAVLSPLVSEVYTIEIVEKVASMRRACNGRCYSSVALYIIAQRGMCTRNYVAN